MPVEFKYLVAADDSRDNQSKSGKTALGLFGAKALMAESRGG